MTIINSPINSIDVYGQLGLNVGDNVAQTIRPLITSQWRFNLSNFLVDSVGSNTLTNINSVSQSSSDKKEGNASAQYNSTNDYLQAADDTTLKATQDFTISVWVKFGVAGAFQSIFAKDDAFTSREYGFFLSNNNTVIGFVGDAGSNVGQVNSIATVSSGTWYHLAFTHEIASKTLSIYVNGIFRNSAVYSLTTGNGTNAVTIGSDLRPGGLSLSDTSKVDNVIWCQSVLSAEQIRYLYTHPDFF